MRKLEDLDFADDLALLTHRLEDMQEKIESLGEAFQRVGLKINKEKTKVTRANNIQEAQISIGEAPVEDVGEFVYLGSKISQSGGREEDIPEKTRKARQDFFFFFFFFFFFYLQYTFYSPFFHISAKESGRARVANPPSDLFTSAVYCKDNKVNIFAILYTFK